MANILLKARLALELPPINAALERAAQGLPEPVRPVARHIFEAGGKRLRPLLTGLTARLLGSERADISALAVTMAMLHAATLLHDDVLDNAVSRRGKPAAHTLFEVTPTILAGDALLAEANALVAGFGDPRLSLCFSEATSRTAAGEILEIAAQRRVDTSAAEYEEIVRGKTAWLIRASCQLGALRAGATDAQAAAAAAYGENLGMAFQIVDDALDFAPSSLTGKPEGGDVREGKLTPPIFFYANSLAPAERDAFFARFAEQSFTDEDVRHVIDTVRAQGFDDKTRGIADTYLRKAQENLDALTAGLPASPYGEILTSFIGYVRNRDA